MHRREEGFTLAEVLVTIVILASLAVVLSEFTQSFMRSLERTEARIEKARSLLSQIEQTRSAEEGLKRNVESLLWLEGEASEVRIIGLVSPKIDSTAACVYDLAAQQCR
jgi:prepilin-type N-terminal cleavage/methylation domain-containing protein